MQTVMSHEKKMKKAANIFELIEHEHFRERPSIYLRGEKVLDFIKFLDAYQICESNNFIFSGILDFFNEFTIFLYDKLKREVPNKYGGNFHWYQIIEMLALKRNEAELDLFFKFYDEFLNKEIEKLANDINELDKKKESIHMNDPAIYAIWGKLVEVLCRNIRMSCEYLRKANQPTIAFVSEVAEEVYFKSNSKSFLRELKKYNESYPELKLNLIVDKLIEKNTKT